MGQSVTMICSVLFSIFFLSTLTVSGAETDFLERLERLSERIQTLEEQSEVKDEKIELLTGQLQDKSEQVILYECAWQNQWGVNYETGKDEIVVFDKIFFQDLSPGLTAQPSLDISSGVFTCQVPGIYQVTVSLNAHDNTEHTSSFINLFKNGEMTEE